MHKQLFNLFLAWVMSVFVVSGVQAAPLHEAGWNKNKSVLYRAARDTGMSMSRLTAYASIESSLGKNNYNRTSGAEGMMQVVPSTWTSLVKKHRKKYGLPRNVRPSNKYASLVLGAEYVKENREFLQRRLHRPVSDADVYIAYLLGPGGASKVLKANPNHRVTKYVNVSKGNRNLFYRNGKAMTVAQFRASIEQKFALHQNSYRDVIAKLQQQKQRKDEVGFERLIAKVDYRQTET